MRLKQEIMMGPFIKKVFSRPFLGLLCLVSITGMMVFAGCGEPEKAEAPEFLIKTPSMGITCSEFSEELDLKSAAYPYNIHENPAEYNEMVMDLVKMLSQEVILLSAAVDKGVTITEQEIEDAEKAFRKDYPEDSFEQILLENAISYSFWKKRFKKNMIIDKLIDQELRKKVVITPEDIVTFYNEHHASEAQNADDNARILSQIESEKELVSRLRNQKTQAQYDEWMQQLENDYPVEINKEKLKKNLIDIENNKGNKNEKKE